MKKITALMLTALICISFAACTKTAENNSNNNTATAVSSVSATENTTEQIIEKTTSPPKSDSQKGSELRTAVSWNTENSHTNTAVKQVLFMPMSVTMKQKSLQQIMPKSLLTVSAICIMMN